jgi:hypothetical protein
MENLQYQIQFSYNSTAQRSNETHSETYRLTLAWNTLQTYVCIFKLRSTVTSDTATLSSKLESYFHELFNQYIV